MVNSILPNSSVLRSSKLPHSPPDVVGGTNGVAGPVERGSLADRERSRSGVCGCLRHVRQVWALIWRGEWQTVVFGRAQRTIQCRLALLIEKRSLRITRSEQNLPADRFADPF